ncbi:MAG: hypothetical protein LBR08_04120, partial [Bacteroidales bacterium]|nr:hypothetical protein [Bacteroidales bacterium]
IGRGKPHTGFRRDGGIRITPHCAMPAACLVRGYQKATPVGVFHCKLLLSESRDAQPCVFL